VIFTVQVAYSRWWIARVSNGPLQWLGRGATYGRFPPLRSARVEPAVVAHT
jgi:uncharacterized protein